MWDMRWTTESCVDVIIERASFGPLHQDAVKPYLDGYRSRPCEKCILQSGNPGPKARELGCFKPRVMICDDVGMTQCFEQVDFA